MRARARVLLSLLLAAGAGAPAAAQQDAHATGRAVYDRWCSGCHGAEGRGDGPAAGYMLPRPRDFTRGTYQIKSTPSGELPTDADILRIIDEGMPGTAMPGWREKLSSQQRQALVAYLKSFSPFFETEPAPTRIAPGRAPRVTEEGLAVGREVFDRLECWRCHGQAGRGDGPSAHEQVDDDGFPVRPADLHKNWRFTGGGRVEDIYLRLLTGLEGTPMPSQADALASGVVSEEELWRLAQYVRSLSPDRPPRVREVVRAARVEEGVPATAGDPAWEEAEEYYLPLVGQIIVRPRWFAPSVSGVWVRALHDGSTLALRLRWHDPSQSPEPRWRQYQEAVLAAMEPREGGAEAGGAFPDAFAVQFPRQIPTGMDRPYFLMGTAREPVYLWRWESGARGPVEALARGLGRVEPLPGGGGTLTGQAEWSDGEWRLVLRRALDAGEGGEAAGRLAFATGRAIPIAFFAWDGDSGEADTRASISTWYYLHLDEPPGRGIYVAPISATLLTLMLGLGMVMRAQRRSTADAEPSTGSHQPKG